MEKAVGQLTDEDVVVLASYLASLVP